MSSPPFKKATVLIAILVGTAGSARAQGVCSGTAPVNGATLSSFPVVTGLTGRLLLVTAPPGDRDRLFVVEQEGIVRIHRRGDPPDVALTFLDITDRVQGSPFFDEMGLLGLAFDPDYDSNGYFYVNYTEGGFSPPWFTVVSRFSRSDSDPDAADPGSEVVLLRIGQPQTNHNGGQIFFGIDGFLYVASGDGGSAGDPHGICGNGQNRSTLLGKMLRLDVRGADPMGVPPDCGGALAGYTIPSSNPFALTSTPECGEIWSYGLRNPWRSAIDPANGDLYVADVGQDCSEEVNVLPGGDTPPANFGWRSMEGSHCFDPNDRMECNPNAVVCAGVPICGDPSLTLPVLEYSHAEGCSITGGAVYRGCQMPELHGTYFYGDYCSGFVRSFRLGGGIPAEQADHTAALDPGGTLLNSLTSFGLDAEGELYIVNRGGTVLRVGPLFTDLEVSGPGAGAPLLLGDATWGWGDLSDETMRPVSFYRVYRGTPAGTFRCRFTTTVPEWPGGDPDVPAPGGLFAYVVTAVSPSGEETRPGIAGQAFLLDVCP